MLMDTHGTSNNTPSINSAPVVHTNPLKIQTKRIVFLILLVVFIVVITIAIVFSMNFQSPKTSQPTTPTSQTPPVNLKTNYQNPFDRRAQYENPFENLK